MWIIARKLALGVSLIVAAAAILLLSDLNRRKKITDDMPRIAVMQYASNSLLDEGVQGVLAGLGEAGFVDGSTISIGRYNSEADMPTANTIASEITDGRYKMVITVSTPSLQVVASANKMGRTTQVFGCVTDPYGAGVGITGPGGKDHPRHLVGIGTFQPVEKAFDIAKQMLPALKRVGVVWNPSEACSEACTRKARAKCAELGIDLSEATVDNAAGVSEAAKSLIGRNVQAIWVGGDNTVTVAIEAVVKAAAAARIPVFTNTPIDVKRGAMFSLGANYFEVGRLVAQLASKVLRGLDTTTVRIDNVVPERLAINEVVAKGLKEPWRVTPELLKRAEIVVTAEGTKDRTQVRDRKPQPGRTYKIGLVYFGPDPSVDLGIQGITDALRDTGLVEGQNLEIRKSHANGEIANITQILQTFAGSDVDLIMPMTTPCLSAACASVKSKPVVFTVVYDPLAAGAGKSRSDHLPNVTGVGSFPPLNDMFDAIGRLLSKGKVIGTIYNASEANSRKVIEVARGIRADRGLRLVEKTVIGTNEVVQAAQALVQENVDLFWITGDNTAQMALDGIAKIARQHRLPLIIDEPQFISRGVVFACGIGCYEAGVGGGRLAARVLLGEDPDAIPIEEIAVKRMAVNFDEARRLGITYPAELLGQCKVFCNLPAKLGRPAKVAIVQIVENPAIDRACNGVIEGLKASGLILDCDFTVKRFNAQGETSQLPLIFSTLNTDKPDLIVTAGTPVLQAATRIIRDTPIVFTVASDPKKLGMFTDGERPANIVGVHDDPPVDRLLDLAAEHERAFDTVGIVWDPSQRNSEISVVKLREACKERKLKLVEATANVVSDLNAATQSLCDRGVKLIVLSADNLTTTGFPAIVAVAKANHVPVYVTEPSLVDGGASGAIGDDYGEWGVQSGKLAARVLAGVSPKTLPIEKTTGQRTVIGSKLAAPIKTAAPLSKKWNLHIVAYNDTPPSDDAMAGVRDALAKSGLVEGKDYTLKINSAQGDIATLSSIMNLVRSEQADMLIVTSTPTLQAAMRQIDRIPVIFTCVASGVLAGAGESETNHRPNVAGITTCSPFDEMAVVLKGCLPNVRTVGTLFTPAEANSVLYKEYLDKALKAKGITLVAVPANTSADIPDAALALCQKKLDAVCQITDNLTSGAFSSIVQQAETAKLPIFSFVSSQPAQGGVLAVARDYRDAGVEAGELAVRVIRGESPAKIPFTNMKTTRLVVNLGRASQLGLKIPDAIVRRADKVIN